MSPIAKFIAVYVRVSSSSQNLRSQIPDLEKFAKSLESIGSVVRWYRDKASGKTMDRPGWNKLERDLLAGNISCVVCWRLDRLGRTARGLTALFAELTERGIGLKSLRDGLDLETAAGRLMANMVASVAQYETEIRSERVLAGIEAARAAGKKWGGSKAGRRVTVTEEKESVVRSMANDGKKISVISRTVGLSRPTIYKILGSEKISRGE